MKPRPASNPDPSPVANLGPSLRLEPTSNVWLNAGLPKTIRPGWGEVKELRDGEGVVYRNAFGLTVRLSGARRADSRRWLYLLVSRPDREPDRSDLREVVDLFFKRGAVALDMLVPEGMLPPRHVLVMVSVDGASVPAGVGPTAEFR